MEKLLEMRNKFFKFLPNQPVAFQNPPQLSPNRCVAPKGYRSPCRVSIIPLEARRKHRKNGSFSVREPTSPKVSCMGQVEGKKKGKAPHKRVQNPPANKGDSVLLRAKKVMLCRGSGDCEVLKQKKEEEVPPAKLAPSLGAMKKFAGGRRSAFDFDGALVER